MRFARKYPWATFWLAVLCAFLLAAAGWLGFSCWYMGTHSPGEWLMQKHLELENDGAHTYELLAERDIGGGLTAVFYQENNWLYSYVWGVIVADRGLWYTAPLNIFCSAPALSDEYPPKPAQHYISSEFTWCGEDYVLDFGAITDPAIEAVYVGGVEEPLIDTGDGWRLFYAVVPASEYGRAHETVPTNLALWN